MLGVDITSRDLRQLGCSTELMERQWAPCRGGCPVHADVRRYVELIAEARWREAIDVIRDRLPFAAVCGRVCHHPCETECRRQDVDDAVAIREVKRFVAELQGADGSTVHKAACQDKARVAIIGSGPSGMAAALDLARWGYRPTVFEKFPVPGGIPATAIPNYRLPLEIVKIDTDWIAAHGVEVVTGVEIGADKTIDDLLGEGFDAVVIAAGLAKSRSLPLPGADHRRVYRVMEFLTELAFDRKVDIGSDVLVIGGGNVAMDAARSAVRLGAKRVRAMSLEDEQEMPAWEWELTEAAEEGVEFIHRRGPVEIRVADGEIVGLTARKVTRVFDADHRFSPQYDDSDVVEVDCDTVIFAIGQQADMGFTAGSSLETDARGRLVFDARTRQTSIPSVFACGEIVTPPGSVVEACASGQRAAEAIDLYLSGKPIEIDESTPPVIDTIPAETAEKVLGVDRQPVLADPPDERRKTFKPFEQNLTVEGALCEARRCMGCGSGAEVLVDKCAACLTCLRVCPFDIPVVTDVARIDSVMCQSCGICIAECPANAIVPKGRAVADLRQRTVEALAELPDGSPRLVAYVGGFRASAEQWRGEADAAANVAALYLHSTSRLSVPDILAALEAGADGVLVVCCAVGTDRYPGVADRTRKRVEQARAMLAEIGMPADCLQLFEVADQGAEAVREALQAGAARVVDQ